MLVTGSNKSKIKELKEYLRASFKGQASWDNNVNSFLGIIMIEIHYDLNKGELSMEVTAKVNDLFEKLTFFGTGGAHSCPRRTPLVHLAGGTERSGIPKSYCKMGPAQ